MKVSYRWLRELAPGIGLSPEEAVERLALRGAPVEEVVDLSAGLGDVTIGQVLEAAPHPGADRLTLCRVAGPAGEVPVVCGAPDVRAGAFYPFAPVGSTLPGGFKIGRRKIRGERSEGMLCSERELGLGADHAGIMLLDGDFDPGAPFVEAVGLNDFRFDVEVTPNRGDLLSHVGVARELHPRGQAAIALPPLPATGPGAGENARSHARPGLDAPERGGGAGAGENAHARPLSRGPMDPDAVAASFARGGAEAESAGVAVAIEDPELCPRYLGAVIRGVSVGPSPLWLANRLRAVGARPVNNVVDATNYAMLELGQPLHAFDLAKLEGSAVVVGKARPGESLVTLDGEDRALSPEMLTIRDAARPVAVAGVMGGAASEVSTGTADVLLECALFEPRQVRAARRALGMSTDASYRFERGVDPETMETAVHRAASLIAAVAGGAPCGQVIDACPSPWKPPVVELRPSRVRRVLGVGFQPDEIAGLLTPLGYAMAEGDGADTRDRAADAPADRATVGDALDDRATVGDAPADRATVGDALDDRATVGDAPADRATVGDALADRVTVGDAPAVGDEGALRFRVPGHRSWDTLREIDLIEEVARTHGYDAFPETLGPYRPGTVPDHPLFRLEDALRAAFVADGISEAQTPALCPVAHGDVTVLNPVSDQENRLRRDLLSGLLRHVERNMARGTGDVRLFELGTAFAPPEPRPGRTRNSSAGDANASAGDAVADSDASTDSGKPASASAPRETTRAAVVLAGRRAPVHWSGDGERFGVHDAARMLALIAREAHPAAQAAPADGEDPRFVTGRWYWLVDEDGQVVGAGGELRPANVDLPPWAGVVVGAEVVLPEAPAPRPDPTAKPLPDQPSSTRDVAMLVPRRTPAGVVLEAVRGAKAAVLEDAEIFDVYEGGDLPAGSRSVAFRLRFRASDRTLTEAEVDRALRRVLRKVKEETGVEPRVVQPDGG